MGWGELKAAFPGKLESARGEGDAGAGPGQHVRLPGLPACLCVSLEGAALSKGPLPA